MKHYCLKVLLDGILLRALWKSLLDRNLSTWKYLISCRYSPLFIWEVFITMDRLKKLCSGFLFAYGVMDSFNEFISILMRDDKHRYFQVADDLCLMSSETQWSQNRNCYVLLTSTKQESWSIPTICYTSDSSVTLNRSLLSASSVNVNFRVTSMWHDSWKSILFIRLYLRVNPWV